MHEVTLGQYYPQDSVFHRLDPRTKLGTILLYIIGLFLVKNSLWFLAFLALLILLFKSARIPMSYMLKGLKGFALLLVFTFVFRMLCTPGRELASFWIFQITAEGINKGIQLSARIGLMVAAASLLGYTATPKELVDGLGQVISPLKKIGVPVSDISMMVMIAFRFIPIMMNEAFDLMDAQSSRGVEFKQCSFPEKCRNIFALLVPLFVNSVDRSADLAMAMESRGYTGDGNVTMMYPLEFHRDDGILWALSLLVFAAVVALRILDLL